MTDITLHGVFQMTCHKFIGGTKNETPNGDRGF